jgi:hypothetical protein
MLLVRLSVVLVAFLGFATLVNAQGFGNIVGTVKDPSGAVIPGAKVTATEAGKGFARSAVTDASGYYVIGSLRPADYNLTIEATGFHTYDQKGVTLLADQTLTANAQMQVGSFLNPSR